MLCLLIPSLFIKWLDKTPNFFSEDIFNSLNNIGMKYLDNIELRTVMQEMFENVEDVFRWRFSLDRTIIDLNKVNQFSYSFNPWLSYQFFKVSEINHIDRNLRLGKKDLKLIDLLYNAINSVLYHLR